MVDVVDLKEKFNLVNEHWSPHVVGNVNNCAVKVAKLKGDFPWHFARPRGRDVFCCTR